MNEQVRFNRVMLNFKINLALNNTKAMPKLLDEMQDIDDACSTPETKDALLEIYQAL